MTNKYKKKTYKVRRVPGGILLLADGSNEFDRFLTGDEVTANVTRRRPRNCVNLREIAEDFLEVPYGSFRQQICTGRYRLPEKQESLCRADFYNVKEIKKWVKQQRRGR